MTNSSQDKSKKTPPQLCVIPEEGIPVVPGSGSQDGDEGQTGAEEDPAANVKDGVLAAPPDEGPEIVGTVVLPGLLPGPPGYQAAALTLAAL